jgi:hypothetical protein
MHGRIQRVSDDGSGRESYSDGPDRLAWLRREQVQRVVGVLAVADAAGVTIAVALIAVTVIRGRPANGAGTLLIPGIPLLVAGQL